MTLGISEYKTLEMYGNMTSRSLQTSQKIPLWTRSQGIFNERAARRSRSTSRFVCMYVTKYLCMSPLKLATRFHKTCNALATQEQLQSGITMASVIRIDSNFFCVNPCVSPLRGWQHATCPTCTWARARAVFWRHVPKKVKKRNFLNFYRRKKLNSKIWGRRKF